MSRHGTRIRRLEGHSGSTGTEARVPPDPVAFARSLGIEPDPWQRDLLTATDERIILNCARQSGKSTVVAVLALHHALTTPSSLVLIFSPSQRQSDELFRKVTGYYRDCGEPGHASRSASALEFANRSRIVSLPASEATTRGFSAASLVLIDEAAQVPDDLYFSVSPTRAVSQGRLILLSTPRGTDGVFWRSWHDEGWKKIEVTAEECPRIPQAFLDQERRAMGNAWYSQEYCCAFVQPEGSPFNDRWIQFYWPDRVPPMDVVVQSWDTALTKSATSDYVVGQVWGRAGADYYLLDQVRSRFDFDETVGALVTLSERWPQATAKIVEAQALGAPLASHLKHQVDGIVPVHVKESKEARALSCLPLWQSGHVYVPRPDNERFAWVRDYVHELTTFPNGAHDDMVDATTLALSRLREPLFPHARRCVADTASVPPSPDGWYRVGWVPARPGMHGAIIVLDEDTNDVASFERVATPKAIEGQIARVVSTALMYNDAYVRAFAGVDEAMLSSVERRGTPVQRVEFNAQKWGAACENLSMMVKNGRISFPDDADLIAELEVFASDVTFSGMPDYTLQLGHDAAIRALCLVTYDQSAEKFEPWEIWYSYDDPNDWWSGSSLCTVTASRRGRRPYFNR